ncbi:MAG: hypothetical protein QXO47_02050 [Thermoproteota archaeon]
MEIPKPNINSTIPAYRGFEGSISCNTFTMKKYERTSSVDGNKTWIKIIPQYRLLTLLACTGSEDL